jgi:hypothetical protein
MNYNKQITKLIGILNTTKNLNAISDFYVQLGQVSNLNTKIITDALNQQSIELPAWVPDTRDCDVKNNIVFLIWQRYETVTDEFDDAESLLGTKIEELGIILETVHYCEHIHALFNEMYDEEFISYGEWIKHSVDTHGLTYTVNLMKQKLFSSIGQ